MSINKHGRVTEQINNFNLIRGLAFLNGDPDHWTNDSLVKLFAKSPQTLSLLNVTEIMKLAHSIESSYMENYADYLEFLATSHKVMKALGVQFKVDEKVRSELAGISPNATAAEKYLQHTRKCYLQLTGEELSADTFEDK